MATSFPKLPGYVPTHDCTKVDWKKISHVQLEKIQNPKNAPVPLHALPRKPAPEIPPPKDPKSLSYSQSVFKNPKGADITEKFEPTFVKLDKQVLRFKGYFKESVSESALETYKIRKLDIFIYLEDATISINESKQMNSGTPQGVFLKRQMMLRSDGSGSKMTSDDFAVGKDVTVCGRTIHVYDCDQYTREFYAKVGKPQAEAEEEPQDNFGLKPQREVKVKDNDFAEHYLGGVRVQSQKQFLDNDRKVLKFYARCEKMPFVIHYYLADDTIEVTEVHFNNDGCHPYPMLLKRQKMIKEFTGICQPGQQPLIQEYIKDADFFPDKEWRAYSRVFTIIGVDPYTQAYYEKVYQRKFPIGSLEPHKPEEQKAIVIPPYNGFGDELDSLGYVYKLEPKPPKRDFFKYVDNDKVILRFTAKMNTTVPEDIDRRFIVSYYLADNTCSVYEPSVRNSGIAEGKFLERRKYKNVSGIREFIEPSDFVVGGNVIINSYSFQVLSMDAYTEGWMMKNIKK